MHPTVRRLSALGTAGALAVGLAACGGGDNNGRRASAGALSVAAANKVSGPALVKDGTYYNGIPDPAAKKGGALKVISTEGFQHLDPGTAYFQGDYNITSVVHRQLYTYDPADSSKVIPDIASGDPVVSADGKTVTVKIRPNIKYAPAVGGTVKADDVKYAIERGKAASVANGYITSYFGDVVGMEKATGGKVAGIETPDDQTIVFKLDKPSGATLAKALVLPLSSPIPRAYAESKDKKTPNPFDQDPTKQAFTGPYMIKSYEAGRELKLVRNPNWGGKAAGDPRPAYVDTIDVAIGGDSSVNARQVQNTKNTISIDPAPKDAVARYKTQSPKQITFSALGNRYIALNTKKKPFSDLNVRKAAAAVLDRQSMRKQRGGDLVGEIATHFLFPGSPGFDEAGGEAGTGADFLKSASGDLELAKSYLKKAGFKDGMYTGPAVTFVGDTESPGRETTQVAKNSLAKIGIKVNVKSVQHTAMYQKFCQVVKSMQTIDGCPNFGWLPDFVDAGPMLSPVFTQKGIQPTNMNNPSLFADPKIDAEVDKGLRTADEAQRNQILGQADKDITDQVPAIPWLWDTQANIQGPNVHGVIASWNSVWDLAYTSLGS
ncbi:ABC transporter substrate-binding protein [Patulibacter minatonensis]|uniref:ABC transporter substrate-binding protein n=1 Tax=Patulibacter minatonensis TaxID=298163 RepID=UPI000A04F488|nr:ABC transporter substrate-binding protein [Patulibacter minatonensis]